jgi:hypothetical protein
MWQGMASRTQPDQPETGVPGVESPTELPELTDAERAVADALPIGADPEEAARVLGRVPLWFHTFALNAAEGLYTPGAARDHRYRLPFLPESFAGQRVLDVGTFDGFYAFLAEHRGAARVVAVDNEQYVAWVKARWGVRAQLAHEIMGRHTQSSGRPASFRPPETTQAASSPVHHPVSSAGVERYCQETHCPPHNQESRGFLRSVRATTFGVRPPTR